MATSVSPLYQTLGNICGGLATGIVLLLMSRLLSDFANKYPSDNQWLTSALRVVIPLWLLLMVALLCVTASGGFDWLKLGRPALYVFTVGAAVALAAATLLAVAMYIRPGFTPRGLYVPVIYLVPLSTVLLVVLSLNTKLAPGMSTLWLRVPWAIFTAVSIVACLGFVGRQTVRGGMGGVMSLVYRLRNPGPSSEAIQAKLSTLDPQRDFDELLRHAGPDENRAVREAVTAKLRANPQFIETLAAALNSSDPSNGLSFLHSATLSSAEQRALAAPARKGIERFTREIPAPNYMSPERRKQLQRWGRRTFPVIIEKFAGTDVDFSKTMSNFEYALRPDDTRR
jgi:hypothetical protein